METNIISNLTSFINYTYEWGEKAVLTTVYEKMYEEARIICHTSLNQAFGAVQFAAQLCIENGYPDMAKEIENKWEQVWSVWYKDLALE